MADHPSRIAILPARGGSKRIKDKNIRPFCGRPIIHYPLAAAKESGLFDLIHVSTESPRIREVVVGLGFPVDFLRAPELADDQTPIAPVLRWVLERYAAQGRKFDDVFLIMPCAPLIEAEDLRQGYQAYLRHGRERPLLAVSPFPVPIEWAFEKDKSGGLKPCQPGMAMVRSQDLGRKYYDTGAFAVFNASSLLHAAPTDEDYVSYLLPKSKAVDIDDPEDLELAETLYLGRLARRRAPEEIRNP